MEDAFWAVVVLFRAADMATMMMVSLPMNGVQVRGGAANDGAQQLGLQVVANVIRRAVDQFVESRLPGAVAREDEASLPELEGRQHLFGVGHDRRVVAGGDIW